MQGRLDKPIRRAARSTLAALTLALGLLAVTSVPAGAATVATFSGGILTVTGDSLGNSITFSRDAAGTILVNGGAVTVIGGTPTVANTTRVRAIGLGGADVITISEVNGALPAAQLYGGAGNDVVTGGSGADQLYGQAGNDTLLGKGGADLLFGATENDTLTGGDANDQVFGQGGNDRMIWNPGDDTDLNEGGTETDTVEVNGGGGTEQFATTANGVRVRFDRINPAPFAIDIGTSENLVLNANGGDDQSSATGNLAALIRSTVDGGAGLDTLLGSNGADVLLGGDGNDFVDGQQGNDITFLGAGNDTAQWDPGDGSDVIEGQGDTDTLTFNGANINENMSVSAVGGRARFFRDVGTINMDLNDVESIVARALGGVDNVSIEDVSGTDVTSVSAQLAGSVGGGDDAAADVVRVIGSADDDFATVTGGGTTAGVSGLPAQLSITGAGPGTDRLVVDAAGGADLVDASLLPASAVLLTLDGGDGDDVLIAGAGGATLLGGAGDDVLIGGPGADTINGGTGDNVVIDSAPAAATGSVSSATTADKGWVKTHARTVKGRTVLDVGDEQRTLSRSAARLLRRAPAG